MVKSFKTILLNLKTYLYTIFLKITVLEEMEWVGKHEEEKEIK